MKPALKKELIKQGILLGVGVIALIIFLMSTGIAPSKYIEEIFGNTTSIIISMALLFYPLAIAYGARDILNIISRAANAVSLYFGGTASIISIKFAVLIIGVTLAIGFGWIKGVYNAIKVLINIEKTNRLIVKSN